MGCRSVFTAIHTNVDIVPVASQKDIEVLCVRCANESCRTTASAYDAISLLYPAEIDKKCVGFSEGLAVVRAAIEEAVAYTVVSN